MEIIKEVKQIKGVKELMKHGEVFLVGGIVRDQFLGKESKDIDLIVRLITIDKIKEILRPFGKMEEVGESFGVLKFHPNDVKLPEPIDIALPRIDKKVGEGHHGIEAQSDPNLSIEKDLQRRDFTINSIAINLKSEKIVDPFNGVQDLENKIIRATSILAFSEDPLRMIRGIQFSSRFGFEIEEETWEMIVDNAPDIKTISGERILTELEKIFTKGDKVLGINLLVKSGLHKQIFGFEKNLLTEENVNIKTKEDFYFLIVGTSGLFRDALKGDADTSDNLKRMIAFGKDVFEKNTRIFDTLSDPIKVVDKGLLRCKVVEHLTPELLHSGVLGVWGVDEVFQEFINNEFPFTLKQLNINGNDLMKLGLKGKEIGDALKLLHFKVLKEEIKNNKVELLNAIR